MSDIGYPNGFAQSSAIVLPNRSRSFCPNAPAFRGLLKALTYVSLHRNSRSRLACGNTVDGDRYGWNRMLAAVGGGPAGGAFPAAAPPPPPPPVAGRRQQQTHQTPWHAT